MTPDTIAICLIVIFLGTWSLVSGLKDGTVEDLVDAFFDSFD